MRSALSLDSLRSQGMRFVTKAVAMT